MAQIQLLTEQLIPSTSKIRKAKCCRLVSSQELKIEGIKGTDVVQISYKNNNPELAAKIVNEVIKSYIDLNIQANQDEARTAKGVLVTEVPKAEEVVRRAESKLRVFKEQNKVVVLQQEATAAVDTISKL